MKRSLAMALMLGIAVVSLVDRESGTSETAAPGTTAARTTTAGTMTADTTAAQTEAPATGAEGPITMIPREDGSGIRGTFIELFGVEMRNDTGEKEDMTTEDAEITNSALVMMTTVASNMEAAGYISLGSLDDTVKVVKIDGVEITVDNIKSSSCKIARPFDIATKEDTSEVTVDFIKYMMNEEGQKVVEDSGYISRGNEGAYKAANVSGKTVVAGSSSVTPVAEKLKEAYVALNPGVTIEVQQSDFTTGTTSAVESVYDIGMASRKLKDMELERGIKDTVVTMDGIAVIISNGSLTEGLSNETVKGTYTGEITDWADAQ